MYDATCPPPHTILRAHQDLSSSYRPTPAPGKALPQPSAFILFSLEPAELKGRVFSQPNPAKLRVYVFSSLLPPSAPQDSGLHLHMSSAWHFCLPRIHTGFPAPLWLHFYTLHFLFHLFPLASGIGSVLGISKEYPSWVPQSAFLRDSISVSP